MDVLNDSTSGSTPIIPGAIDKKTDKRLFYCNYITVGGDLAVREENVRILATGFNCRTRA